MGYEFGTCDLQNVMVFLPIELNYFNSTATVPVLCCIYFLNSDTNSKLPLCGIKFGKNEKEKKLIIGYFKNKRKNI